MGVRSFIHKLTAPIRSIASRPSLRAKYDAAQTNEDNRKHWSNADAMSADASANPEVRQTLRIRSRYEFANNAMAAGIINTLSQHVVAGGPTLTCGNTAIEGLWIDWCKRVRLEDKLRLVHMTWMVSGEAFITRYSSILYDENEIQLDLQIVEPDRVTAIFGKFDDYYYDGIQYDKQGNPKTYYIQPDHPGDESNLAYTNADPFRAENVYHVFRAMRPGQRRGVPTGTPSLPLFAYKRRYTLATIAAAETHANLTAIATTQAPVDSDGSEQVFAPFEAVDFERNMITAMPAGYDIKAFNPAQPVTNYEMFDSAIVKEIARCFDMPYTIAALDSSKANMSAAYLDWQTYNSARILPDRRTLDGLLRWIFNEWLGEAILVGLIAEPPEFVDFLWSSVGEHADPKKVADAHATKLATGQTNLAKIHARGGDDWEEQQALAARTLGISVPEYQALLRQSIFKITDGKSEVDEEDEDGLSEYEEAKVASDAYGVGVRAGTITPQPADEDHFRNMMKLPAMSQEAKRAWKADDGVRRPITLQASGESASPQFPNRMSTTPNGVVRQPPEDE